LFRRSDPSPDFIHFIEEGELKPAPKGEQHRPGLLTQLERYLNAYPVTNLTKNGKLIYVLSY